VKQNLVNVKKEKERIEVVKIFKNKMMEMSGTEKCKFIFIF
jgi:hypothetical protein